MAAVLRRRKSLLPAGITACTGDFESGDVVDLLGPDGQLVARGFVGHDAGEMPGIMGRSLSELAPELRHPVVHADDLIAVTPASLTGSDDRQVHRDGPRTEEGARI